MTSVLVTGGTGYLGREILSQLNAAGIGALSVGRSRENDVICDLLDAHAVARLVAEYHCSPVIHCAAAVPKVAEDYMNRDSAAQSLAMARILAGAAPKRIVFTSSMTVYPDGIGVAREDDARVPEAGGYSSAKLLAETALLEQSGLVAIVLRLPGLFGNDRRSGLLFNSAVKFVDGRTPEFIAELPQWAAMDVRDAATMCIRALCSEIASSIVINVGYPETMSIGDAIARLAMLFEAEVLQIPSPSFAFDLTRMHALLGLTPQDFETRLAQLAHAVRHAAKSPTHA